MKKTQTNMPQIFQVLKCYKCSVFQVHQARKDNKWVCKLCGEKQSVKRHYGIGIAKDCRLHVQKLNNMRGEKDQTIKIYISDSSDCDGDVENSKNNDKTERTHLINKKSKWTEYIDESQDIVTNDLNNLKKTDLQIEIHKYPKLDSIFCNQIDNLKKTEEYVTFNNNYDSLNNIHTDYFINMTNDPLQGNKFAKTLPSTSSDMSQTNKKSHHKSNVLIGNETAAKTSKWHQFIEENESAKIFNKNCSSRNDLFSLCDDDEIDNILHI